MHAQSERQKAVARMLEHIERNIHAGITMQSLAKSARYSMYHSARIFKQVTGQTPFAYIRQRRLSQAAKLLGDKGVRVIDVAFDFVFDSHEGFTRAFSKQFGMSPTKFQKVKRKNSVILSRCSKDPHSGSFGGGADMSSHTKPQVVFVQVVKRPQRKMILKRGIQATNYFEYCDEVSCDVWEILSSIKDALHEPMGLWLPPKYRKLGSSIYAQGVEVAQNYSGEIPAGFDVMELAACMLMIFQGQPFEDDDFMQAIEQLSEVIDTYNPESVGYAWADEDGPRFQLEPLGYRGYIAGRPVRPLKS